MTTAIDIIPWDWNMIWLVVIPYQETMYNMGIEHSDMIWYEHGTYGGFPKSWGYPKSSKHRHAYINNHFSIETMVTWESLFLRDSPYGSKEDWNMNLIWWESSGNMTL